MTKGQFDKFSNWCLAIFYAAAAVALLLMVLYVIVSALDWLGYATRAIL